MYKAWKSKVSCDEAAKQSQKLIFFFFSYNRVLQGSCFGLFFCFFKICKCLIWYIIDRFFTSRGSRFIKIVVWTSKLIGNQSSSKYILHYTVTDSRQRIEFRLQPLHMNDSSNKMWFKKNYTFIIQY